MCPSPGQPAWSLALFLSAGALAEFAVALTYMDACEGPNRMASLHGCGEGALDSGHATPDVPTGTRQPSCSTEIPELAASEAAALATITFDLPERVWRGLWEDGAVHTHTHTQRIVPFLRNGAVAGFKLYSITPGSLGELFGLRNGDVVLRANGIDLTTPDSALAAYVDSRDSRKLVLELERRGRRLRHVYRIAPNSSSD